MGWIGTMRALAVCVLLASTAAPVVAGTETATIVIGSSVTPLNGPWRFRLGDDPRGADPALDDSAWERVDLTPKPGAHDGDVGISGFVPGWSARGHRGASGFAWYRLPLSLTARSGNSIAITGPTLVDGTYQLYVDGKLLGGSGDFSAKTPSTRATKPRLFVLPAQFSASAAPHLVALRVWTDPALARAPDAGGLHVAPQIGSLDGANLLFQAQWGQTLKGYTVDFVEGWALVLIAAMAAATAFAPGADRRGWLWLAAGLVLIGLNRLQQSLFFWWDVESLYTFDVCRSILLTPLSFLAWTLALRRLLAAPRAALADRIAIGLTGVMMLVALGSRAWFAPELLHGIKPALVTVAGCLRWAYAPLFAWIFAEGFRHERPSPTRLALGAAALLTAAGLFAAELSQLGVKGIWFPYGVGVSRTEYAWALLFLVLLGVILRRLAKPDQSTA